MKAAAIAGALAAAMWSSAVLAHDENCPENTQANSSEVSSEPSSSTASSDYDSGNVTVEGEDQSSSSSAAIGGSGNESWDTSAQATTTTPAYAQPVVEEKPESKADMRGLLVTLGGGIEGYTGDTHNLIKPGATYGVNLALKPTKVLGIELGYSGAVNEFKGAEDVSGADIVRNGGQVVGTLGLSAAPVQPYILGGVGISRYNVRGSNSLGLKDDTNGAVPLGAGLRTHIGNFTADLRGTYNVMFDQDLAPTLNDELGSINNVSQDGRYQGTLSIGAMF